MRKAFGTRRIAALLVNDPASIRWLSGFTGSNAVLLLRDRGSVLVTDARYREQAEQEVRGLRVAVAAAWSLAEELRNRCEFTPGEPVGFDPMRTTVAQLGVWKQLFPGVRWTRVSGLVETLRERKHPDEIAAIRRAARMADRVFDQILTVLRAGVSERDIAAEIGYRALREGSEGNAFDPIVVSGPRSALVHGLPSGRKLRAGDAVILDFGCVVDGYRSDITRTVAIGRASREIRRIHSTVLDAQAAALDALAASVARREDAAAASMDAAARDLISVRGYGGYFEHALGHGLGLDVHERPRLSSQSRDHLVPGHVFTVEPGVYVPGVAGVRIEDDVALLPSAVDVLTRSRRELLVL